MYRPHLLKCCLQDLENVSMCHLHVATTIKIHNAARSCSCSSIGLLFYMYTQCRFAWSFGRTSTTPIPDVSCFPTGRSRLGKNFGKYGCEPASISETTEVAR